MKAESRWRKSRVSYTPGTILCGLSDGFHVPFGDRA
jgi:hypothetical protein